MAELSVRSIVGIGAGLLALMLGLETRVFLSTMQVSGSSDLVVHNHAVLEGLEGVDTGVTRAEAGLRGYVLTANEAYFQNFNTGVQQAEEQVEKLAVLTCQDSVQQASLAALRPCLERKFGGMRTVLTLVRRGEQAAAVAAVRVSPALREKAEIDQHLNVMRTEEQHALSLRQQQKSQHLRRGILWFVLLAVGQLGTCAVSFTLIARLAASRRRDAEAFKYQSLHDGLTGLPNRLLLRDRVEQAYRRRLRYPERLFCVLMIDLDGFKAINDTLGHAAGDKLLREISQQLLLSVRDTDTVCRSEANTVVARLGGDEFMVLLEDLQDRRDAAIVAERILQQIETAKSTCLTEMPIGCSIGIAFGDDRDHVESLFCAADSAMYKAKLAGKGCYAFSSPPDDAYIASQESLVDH